MVAVKMSALVFGAAGLLISVTGCGSARTSPPGGPPSRSAAPALAVTTQGSSAAAVVPARPAGGPVPDGFAATSVTFVSADEGFVLGTAPCAIRPCTSIVRTLDRGASWRGLPAPLEPVGSPAAGGRGVWGIRFATPERGFVFGDGLWETVDGGAHWTRSAQPDGSILALAVLDGQVLALTGRCAPRSGCAPRAALMRRPLAGGPWTTITAVRVPYVRDPTDLIGTQGGVAAVLDGAKVLVTSDGGRSFTPRSTPCARPGFNYATSVAVTSAHGLALLCSGQGYLSHTDKRVYVSGDGGPRWTRKGTPSSLGDGGALAAAAPGQLVIVTASAASWLYHSRDAAASWQVVRTEDDGGAGWADIGFTTVLDGVVVHGPAVSDGNSYHQPGQLLLSENGGVAWRVVRF